MENEDRKIDLMNYRLELAEEKLKSSKILLENGQYKDSIGRSYYAIYSTLRAIMAKDGLEHHKHAGVISDFQKNYIKNGIFEKKFSAYLADAFQVRNYCDYDDFYIVSKLDAEQQYQNASEFLGVVKEYLQRYVKVLVDTEAREDTNIVLEAPNVSKGKSKSR